MKTSINIWNPMTGNETVTLSDLKDRINERRKFSLKRNGMKSITVTSTNIELQQVAAHYRSFEIKKFNLAKAIEVFNAGGCQKASII